MLRLMAGCRRRAGGKHAAAWMAALAVGLLPLVTAAQNPPPVQVPPSLQGVPPPLGPPRPPTADLTGTAMLEPDTDRAGGDYRSFAIDGRHADPRLCRDACLREPRCLAFTYVRPARAGGHATCRLKRAVPPAATDRCCISGVRTSR